MSCPGSIRETLRGAVSRRRLFVMLAAAFCLSATNAGAAGDQPLSLELRDIHMSGAKVSDFIRALRDDHHVPVNFIKSAEEAAISLSLPSASVEDALEAAVAQDNRYTYEMVGDRLIVCPDEPKYKVAVGGVGITNVPRLGAADALVEILNQQVAGFEELLPPPIKGDPASPVYTTSVSLSENDTVLGHLASILGTDHSLVFAIVPAPSGLPILTFYRARPAAESAAEGGGASAPVCDVCCPTDITYANVQNLGCTGGRCGARIRFDVTGVVSACDCDGARVTEMVTTDEGCIPGAVNIGGGCPIGSGNTIANCTDTYGLCAAAASFPANSTCTENYTQQISVCGRLVQTVTITFKVTRSGATCTGTVTRTVSSTVTPPTLTCSLGDQSFHPGETKGVACSFTNKTNAEVEVAWSIAGHGANYTCLPPSGKTKVPACCTVSHPLRVKCNAAGNATLTLTTTAPAACTDTGAMTCLAAPPPRSSGEG